MKRAVVEDTYAEAFRSYYSRILITGQTPQLAEAAAVSATGFATSALGCGVEAGVEGHVDPSQTPDGRPGVLVQFHIWKKDPKTMYQVLLLRIGNCVLTAPSASVFDATPKPIARVDLGRKLRFFGDGYEESSTVAGRKVTTIPVMGGSFTAEDEVGFSRGVSGGNLWVMGSSLAEAVEGAKCAVTAILRSGHVITPFPGGICGAGSKVGSLRYKFLKNSTNHPYCPTLRDLIPDSKVPEGVASIIEIVINGTSLRSVKRAMAAGIEAAARCPGVLRISAGNFEGRLGKFKIHLKEL